MPRGGPAEHAVSPGRGGGRSQGEDSRELSKHGLSPTPAREALDRTGSCAASGLTVLQLGLQTPHRAAPVRGTVTPAP